MDEDVIFEEGPLYDETSIDKNNKAIKNILLFFDYKATRPPTPLPRGMSDYQLHGKLKWVQHCHLDNDVVLFYQHKGNIVKLLLIGKHKDTEGKRQQQTAKKLEPDRIQ